MIENTWEGRMERLNFLVKGRLGQLIDTSFEKARLVHDPLDYINNGPDDMIILAYNNQINRWHQVASYNVPRTYSYLPKPKHKVTELDYFLRSVCMIKHEIIWSTTQISKENFAKISSNTNQTEKYKFTVAPWLPSMNNVCKETLYSFVENDNDENDLFFFNN